MIEETLFEAEEKMEKAVSVAKEDLATVRTGRANPAMFSHLSIDYYGTQTPLNQVASINVAEARMLVIKPYDPKNMQAMEKAIRNSDLGVNPTNDGTVIRVIVPQLSEERRRELVRLAHSKGEDARISIRGVRRKAKEALEKLIRDGESGEDDVRRAEKELETTTGKYVHQVDDLVKHKEAELLEV
ncbi:MAG TPA: ribosome recycling factor [Pseudonocardiaceae bacterium]